MSGFHDLQPSDTFTHGTLPVERDGSDSMSTLRLLKYHDSGDQSFPERYMRAGAHADFDVLTLLFQRDGQNGLEVCPGRSVSTEFGYGDEWTPVEVQRGAIVINVGDQLMRWSDDRLKRCIALFFEPDERLSGLARTDLDRSTCHRVSTFHRVRCPREGEYTGPRYSIAFFNQAARDAVIQGPNEVYPKIVSHGPRVPPPPASLSLTPLARYPRTSPPRENQPFRSPDSAVTAAQTGGEFIAQAMQRNFHAAMARANLQTYAIKDETVEANKGFEASGTGLVRPPPPEVPRSAA